MTIDISVSRTIANYMHTSEELPWIKYNTVKYFYYNEHNQRICLDVYLNFITTIWNTNYCNECIYLHDLQSRKKSMEVCLNESINKMLYTRENFHDEMWKNVCLYLENVDSIVPSYWGYFISKGYQTVFSTQ